VAFAQKNIRRIIYILCAISLVITFFLPLNLPIAVSDETRKFYDTLESLEGTGKAVLVIFTIPPAFWGEMYHTMFSALQHIFLLKDVKLVLVPVFAAPGVGLVNSLLRELYNPLNKTYGVDYVMLQFIPSMVGPALAAMADNFRATFQTDIRGTPIDKLPIMENINTLDDFGVVIFACPAKEHPSLAVVLYPRYPKMTYLAICMAGGYMFIAPYLGNVYKAGLWGITMAAEYQQLFGGPYTAARQQCDGISLYHILGLLMLVLGNIIGFREIVKKKGGS